MPELTDTTPNQLPSEPRAGAGEETVASWRERLPRLSALPNNLKRLDCPLVTGDETARAFLSDWWPRLVYREEAGTLAAPMASVIVLTR